jgi:hypothetical protein
VEHILKQHSRMGKHCGPSSMLVGGMALPSLLSVRGDRGRMLKAPQGFAGSPGYNMMVL